MSNGDWESRLTKLEVRVEERFNRIDTDINKLPGRIRESLPCNAHLEKMVAAQTERARIWGFISTSLVVSAGILGTAFAIVWNHIK